MIYVSGDNTSKRNKLVQWTNQCQVAFDKIKDLCCTAPILASVELKQPFILHTNASGIGLGVVHYQVSDGKEHVIGYGSHCLNKGESHYPAHKLEILALKWAVMMVFHEYLFGNHFMVKSDNNSLEVHTDSGMTGCHGPWLGGSAGLI